MTKQVQILFDTKNFYRNNRKVATGIVSNWQDFGETKWKHSNQFGTSTAQIQQDKQITASLIKYTDVQAQTSPANPEQPKS